MSSSQSNQSSNLNQGVPVCGHKIPAKIATSHTEKNPQRRFYSCSEKMYENCGFWRWLDPELTTYYKMSMNNLILQRDKAYEELKFSTLMGEIKNKKYEDLMQIYEVKCAEIEELKLMMKDQEIESRKREWKVQMMYFILGIVLGLFANNMLSKLP